jgi:hypothetical protein
VITSVTTTVELVVTLAIEDDDLGSITTRQARAALLRAVKNMSDAEVFALIDGAVFDDVDENDSGSAAEDAYDRGQAES